MKRKILVSLITALAIASLVATAAGAYTIHYVVPNFSNGAAGTIGWGTEQDDGSWSVVLTADAGMSQAEAWALLQFNTGLTYAELQAILEQTQGEFLISPLLQTTTDGAVWDEGAYLTDGTTYGLWGNNDFYPGGIDDPEPFYYFPWPAGSVGPQPESGAEIFAGFFIFPDVAGSTMDTEIWELCVVVDWDRENDTPGQNSHCWRFVKPEEGDARVPTAPVAIGQMPHNATYALGWVGDYSTLEDGTLVIDFVQTNDALFYAPWNTSSPENGSIAKAHYVTPGDGSEAPVVVELHDQTSRTLGSCPTLRQRNVETQIDWPNCSPLSFWELVTSGEIEHLYGAPVRTIQSFDGTVTFDVQ